MFDLTGKTALVTGATGGIGEAIARALHAQGATVAVSGTRREKLAALAAELGSRVHALPCNLADKDAAEALVPDAEAAMERLDIVVNNAGITRDNLLLRMKAEEWEEVLATNLSGAYRVCKAGLRGMMKARYGRIINIASVVGVMGNAGQANYAAAKAGIIGFSKSLAREVGSRMITVNVVAPGFIDTDMTRVLGEEQRQAMLSQVPLGRLGEASEIAAAVTFLASDAAAYITGETLHVNGGMLMA
jgi:3-oxoacyl-[acyl-carrier protein] reductase